MPQRQGDSWLDVVGKDRERKRNSNCDSRASSHVELHWDSASIHNAALMYIPKAKESLLDVLEKSYTSDLNRQNSPTLPSWTACPSGLYT